MKKHIRIQNGFTLIELLLVIAIIGTLSSVVLFGVSVTREKGRVAAMREQILELRTRAYYLYEQNAASYITATVPPTQQVLLQDCRNITKLLGGTIFFNDVPLVRQIDFLESLSDSTQNVQCGVQPNSYTVAGKLKGSTIFCADSTNVIRLGPTNQTLGPAYTKIVGSGGAAGAAALDTTSDTVCN